MIFANMDVLVKVVVIILATFSSAYSQTYVSYEESLRTQLSSNYTTTVRPANSTSVYIVLLLLSLNALDIGSERMSMTTIVGFNWEDDRLTWTPSAYGGISSIAVSHSTIWSPTVAVENGIHEVGIVGGANSEQVKCRVKSTGTVTWYVPITTTTQCDINISMYPFDTQECYLRLTGFGESSSEVDLQYNGLSTEHYQQSGEWDLQEYWSVENYFVEDNSTQYTRIDTYFKYRRKWQFYGLNLVMPIVLTSILMCAVFALPIEAGEKVGFSLTVLLSYVVFLTWITDNLPAISTDTSVLQVYLALVLCLGVLATLLTTWVLHLYHKDNASPMSTPMRVCVTKILVPLFKRHPCRYKCKKNKDTDCKRSDPNSQPISLTSISKITSKPVDNDEESENNTRNSANIHQDAILSMPDENGFKRRGHTTERSESRDGHVGVTWQKVAVMFDWVFLTVFGALLVLLSSVVLVILYTDYQQ